jgi:hypothetical protein
LDARHLLHLRQPTAERFRAEVRQTLADLDDAGPDLVADYCQTMRIHVPAWAGTPFPPGRYCTCPEASVDDDRHCQRCGKPEQVAA